MPDVQRPDGATIHYETFGNPEGFPFLLIAPGGVNSEIEFWRRSLINPIEAFGDEYRIIAMDQRHAGRSFGPAVPFDYALTAQDQLAVLDDAGAERAHVMGGCIGVAYLLRLIAVAPERVAAAVGQDPVGLDHTNAIEVFTMMFRPTLELARSEGVAAVVERATINDLFVENNAAGPFARRIKADAAFRGEILALGDQGYIDLIEAYAAGLWPDLPPYFTVSAEWLATCTAPLLILPGNDPFHPTAVAESICATAPRARCLPVDCREPENRPATIETIRVFLREHTP